MANADDLYGQEALALLADHLGEPAPAETVVAFRLRNAVIGEAPVTRGVCQVDGEGRLAAIEERRQVFAVGDGRFVAKDGLEPSELDGDALVSMNLWGFGAGHADGASGGHGGGPSTPPKRPRSCSPRWWAAAGRTPRGRRRPRFRVLAAAGRCIGVTHPDDLALVQADLAGEVGRGERPGRPWRAGGEVGGPMTRTSRLVVALGINVVLVVGQVVGGVAAHSTGLLADAGHNLTDVAAVALSLAGRAVGAAAPQRRRGPSATTGHHPGRPGQRGGPGRGHRGHRGREHRAAGPPRRRSTAAWWWWWPASAMVANVAAALVLRDGSHDLNMRAAFVHMAADVAASFVRAGGRAGHRGHRRTGTGSTRWPPWWWPPSSWSRPPAGAGQRRRAARVHPGRCRPGGLRAVMAAVPGVAEVHDLHVWSLSSEVRALSAHLVLTGPPQPGGGPGSRPAGSATVAGPFDLAHTTFELECERCVDEDEATPAAWTRRNPPCRPPGARPPTLPTAEAGRGSEPPQVPATSWAEATSRAWSNSQADSSPSPSAVTRSGAAEPRSSSW